MTLLWVFAFGLCLGSFINVLVWRLPRGGSIISPGSHCPQCRAPIAWRDNVPLLSWLRLGGRCRRCRKRISPRYPFVELAMGLLAAALWWRWGETAWCAWTLGAAAVLLAVSLIDLDTFLIPDELSLGLLGAGMLASFWNPYFQGGALMRAGQACLGAASGFALCWALAAAGEWWFRREAVGGGDVKLLAAVGAWTGALGAYDCLVVGSVLGAIYGGSLILAGRLGRRDPIPFGPFLGAAAISTLFYRLPFGFPLL